MEFIVVLGAVAAIWLLIAASGAFPLVLLWFADFDYVDDPRTTLSRAIRAMGKQWLIDNRFKPGGAVRPLGIRMALFRHQGGHTALAVYFLQGKTITDFVTYFSNGVAMTTSNTQDGIVAPLSPGSVMQCLPSMSFEECRLNHIEAVQLLQGQLNTTKEPMGELDDEMERASRRQIRHIFTRPWLILAFPYRYFVLRVRYRDLTVATQLERGWINIQSLSDRARSRIR